MLVFEQLLEARVFHEARVGVGGCTHVDEGDLGAACPVVVTDEEAAHLRGLEADGLLDGLMEVEEGGIGVDLYFALEVFDFVRNK